MSHLLYYTWLHVYCSMLIMLVPASHIIPWACFACFRAIQHTYTVHKQLVWLRHIYSTWVAQGKIQCQSVWMQFVVTAGWCIYCACRKQRYMHLMNVTSQQFSLTNHFYNWLLPCSVAAGTYACWIGEGEKRWCLKWHLKLKITIMNIK